MSAFSLHPYGVFPRSIQGMAGILLAPLVHADLTHLTSNSLPLLLLGTLVFYLHPKSAGVVYISSWVITNMLVWLFARDTFHIGASGVVYGLAFFLFVSGIVRNDIRSLVISLLVIVFYGGIFAGVLPNQPGISWESHLFGGIVGSILALLMRNRDRPEKVIYDFMEEDDDDSYSYKQKQSEWNVD